MMIQAGLELLLASYAKDPTEFSFLFSFFPLFPRPASYIV